MANTKTTDETTRSVDGTEVVRLATSGANWKATLSAIKTYIVGTFTGLSNPTASIGLAAVNGSATTAMRSDAAPPLDQTAAYAFSGLGATVISQQGASASALTLTGGTVTTSQPLINATQTWNAVGTQFTGLSFNFTNTSSAAGSMPVNYLVGGVSRFKLFANTADRTSLFSQEGSTGTVFQLSAANDRGFILRADTNSQTIGATFTTTGAYSPLDFFVNSVVARFDTSFNFILPSTGSFAFGSTNPAYGTATITPDLILRRAAAATLQLGAANAASPVAQTLQAQGSRAGTDSNVGGAGLTITSGAGTGTGTRSVLTLKSPIVAASGTTGQTQTTGLRIDNGTAVLTGYTVATLPAAPLTGSTAYVTDALAPTFLATVVGGGAVVTPVFYNGTNWVGY